MNPKSAKAASVDAPDAPAEAEDAVVADPGEQDRIEATKKEDQKKDKSDSSEDEDSHYIGIELKDEEGNAVAGEQYRVKLPNGDVVSGYLDDNGKAKVEDISVSGQCKISFPEIHCDEWSAK
ncbi:MAG: hypothetical protein JRI36_08685 [Deltaproteobacteria bacterium]|nr:hypothetical protein [Deltaproteobacteria bacterium]